jgi:two-component system response regulator
MTQEKTILLVEDNPNDAALTVRAFRKNNIDNVIHVATDGSQAIDRLLGAAGGSPAVLPTLVLLDLKLPKIDGLEVLRRIRADERTRLLPVVILTSSKEPADVVNGYRCGANSYVRKPVDSDSFLDAARQLGRYWLILNEAPHPSAW